MREVEGNNILVTGHQHREIAGNVLGKTLIQLGARGKCLGEVVIRVKKEKDQVDSISQEPSLIYVDEQIKTDEVLCARLEPLYHETEKWLDKPLAVVEGDMFIDDPFAARLKEHPYVEFINRVRIRASRAGISCTALLRNERTGLRNPVTMRQIISNYIYENTLKVIELSERDTKEALEQSATYFTIKDVKIIVNLEFETPKQQPYNYDMWEGIEYELKISNPIGKRVTKLLFDGKIMDPEEKFHLVMNDYRTAGAGISRCFAINRL